MRVRFWGTRGSMPVALTWRDVRDRLAQALVAAQRAQARQRREGASPSSSTSSSSPLVAHLRRAFLLRRARAPAADAVLRLRHGQRRAPLRRARARAPVGPPGDGQRLHVAHALGPHHGLPLLRAGLRPGHRHPHPRLPRRRSSRRSAGSRSRPRFPVPFSQLAAQHRVRAASQPGETHEVGGVKVTPAAAAPLGRLLRLPLRARRARRRLHHRLRAQARGRRRDRSAFVEFFRDADLVIFDAMYSLADAISVKADWGHSSNIVGVELCQMARAKHLALFHHEPANDDAAIAAHPQGRAAPRGAHARRRTRSRSSRPTTAWRSISEPRARRARPRSSPLVLALVAWSPPPVQAVRETAVRRLPAPLAARAHERPGHHRRDRRDRARAARPVALAAHAARRARLADRAARPGGDRPRHPVPRARPLLARRGVASRPPAAQSSPPSWKACRATTRGLRRRSRAATSSWRSRAWRRRPPPAPRRFDSMRATSPAFRRSTAQPPGHGLISVDVPERLVRRVPLVARVGEIPVAALALELWRVGSGARQFALSDARRRPADRRVRRCRRARAARRQHVAALQRARPRALRLGRGRARRRRRFRVCSKTSWCWSA